MAIRVRKDGSMVCAAMFPVEDGDTYINDGLHYELSVIQKVIGSESHEKHQIDGRWYWLGNAFTCVDDRTGASEVPRA